MSCWQVFCNTRRNEHRHLSGLSCGQIFRARNRQRRYVSRLYARKNVCREWPLLRLHIRQVLLVHNRVCRLSGRQIFYYDRRFFDYHLYRLRRRQNFQHNWSRSRKFLHNVYRRQVLLEHNSVYRLSVRKVFHCDRRIFADHLYRLRLRQNFPHNWSCISKFLHNVHHRQVLFQHNSVHRLFGWQTFGWGPCQLCLSDRIHRNRLSIVFSGVHP